MLDACMLGGTVIADRTLRRFAHFLEASEMSGHQVSEHGCVAGIQHTCCTPIADRHVR